MLSGGCIFCAAVACHIQRKRDAIRRAALRENRLRPAFGFPNTVQIGDAAAGVFAYIHEAEHPGHCGVSRGRHAAAFGSVKRHTEAAGVGEGDLLIALADDDAAAAMISLYETYFVEFRSW